MTAPADPAPTAAGAGAGFLPLDEFTECLRTLRRDEMWLGMKSDAMADASTRAEQAAERLLGAYRALLEPEYAQRLPDEAVVSREDDAAFRLAIQAADRAYEAEGAAGTKTWFRDFFVPELGRRGLRIVRGAP